MRTRLPLVAIAALSCALPRLARAADCGPALVSTCINDDNFLPHAGASRFLAVGGTETVDRGRVGFGVVASYLSRPILVHVPSPGPGGSDTYAINDQVNTSFLFSFGVTRRLELDLVLPVTAGQGGAGASAITAVSANNALQDTAIRDLRFGFAYALVPRERRDPRATDGKGGAGDLWALTARMEVSAPSGDSGQFAGEGAAVWMPSLAADFRRDRLFGGIELGARLRPTHEFVGARVGSQAVVALGAGVDILPHEILSALIEARALPGFAQQNTDTQGPTGLTSTPNGSYANPAEWTLSARSAPVLGGDFAIQLGGGGPIPFSSDAAITNPRFRFSLSLRYAPMGRDTDGDGVLDADDKCPTVPGVAGNPAGEGCPPSAQTERVDLSGGAPAKALPADPCPREPDTVDGFDARGCPDEDSDKDGIPNRYDKCPLVAEDFAGLADGCPESAPQTPPASIPPQSK